MFFGCNGRGRGLVSILKFLSIALKWPELSFFGQLFSLFLETGSYLGIGPVDDDSLNMSGGDNYEEEMVDKAEEEEKQFNNMMESIGADRVIDE